MQRLLRQIALPLILATSATPALAHWKTETFTANGITFTTQTWGNQMVLQINGSKSTLKGDDFLNALSFTNIAALGQVKSVSTPFASAFTGNRAIGADGCGSANPAGAAQALCFDGFGNLDLSKPQSFTIVFKDTIKNVKPEIKMTLVDNKFDVKGELYQASFDTKTGSYVKTGGTTTPPVTTPPVTTPPVVTPPVTNPPVTTPPVTTPPVTTPPVVTPPVTTPPVITEPAPNEPTTPPVLVPVDMPDPIPPAGPTTPIDPELTPPTVDPQPPVVIPVDGPELPGNGGNPSEVPEPQSLLLLAGGLGALALMRRRKARK